MFVYILYVIDSYNKKNKDPVLCLKILSNPGHGSPRRVQLRGK